MPQPTPSLLADLRRLNRRLTPLRCPLCGADEPAEILRRDRYFLDVRLSVCGPCGMTYLARGLADEAAALFYGGLYQRLMRTGDGNAALIGAQRLAAGYRAHVLRHVIGPLDEILDIGTGLGFFLDACRQSGSRSYHGIEPGLVQRRYAEVELGLGGHIDGDGLDAERALPFRPRIITLFHVLEHLEDPGSVLSRLADWLAPDGWLVIEVPDVSDWTKLGLQHVHVSHRSYFTPETLAHLLARHGFTAVRQDREEHGIHPGNLRALARPGAARHGGTPGADRSGLAAESRRQIDAFNIRTGYSRAALRLLRLAAGGRRPGITPGGSPADRDKGPDNSAPCDGR
jgi:SAM-dependent methyltransferase